MVLLMFFLKNALMCIKKVKLINHDCLPMLLYIMLYIVLAYLMLYIVLAYLMLFAAYLMLFVCIMLLLCQ